MTKTERRAQNAERYAKRQQRLAWWHSLTSEQQYDYRVQWLAKKKAERESAKLDEEFRAITAGN